jgi:hypothetical protein
MHRREVGFDLSRGRLGEKGGWNVEGVFCIVIFSPFNLMLNHFESGWHGVGGGRISHNPA